MNIKAEIERTYDEPGLSLKGAGKVIIDDTLTIRNVNVVEGSKGTFVSLPQQPGEDGKYYPIVTMAKETYKEIVDKVLEAYNLSISKNIEQVMDKYKEIPSKENKKSRAKEPEITM